MEAKEGNISEGSTTDCELDESKEKKTDEPAPSVTESKSEVNENEPEPVAAVEAPETVEPPAEVPEPTVEAEPTKGAEPTKEVEPTEVAEPTEEPELKTNPTETPIEQPEPEEAKNDEGVQDESEKKMDVEVPRTETPPAEVDITDQKMDEEPSVPTPEQTEPVADEAKNEPPTEDTPTLPDVTPVQDEIKDDETKPEAMDVSEPPPIPQSTPSVDVPPPTTINNEMPAKEVTPVKQMFAFGASDFGSDALATLATAAATRAGPPMDVKPPSAPYVAPVVAPVAAPSTTDDAKPAPEDKWFTVGVFQRPPVTVREYFDVDEAFLNGITSNNIPDDIGTVGNFRRFELESNTTYKFRVAAVNTLGVGEWSEVAAFRTCTPGFPGAPCAIRISKRGRVIHISWDRPPGNENILEYSVYLAVKKPDTRTPGFHFIRVYYGPSNQCDIPIATLDQAQVDTVNERQSIIFRIAAKNEMGYGPATQVRWLQEKSTGAGDK